MAAIQISEQMEILCFSQVVYTIKIPKIYSFGTFHKNLAKLHCKPDQYEGRSVNNLQNGTIPSILKIGKNEMHVSYFISNIHKSFFHGDVIIVTSSIPRKDYSSFLLPTEVGGRHPLPPEICAYSDPLPLKKTPTFTNICL